MDCLDTYHCGCERTGDATVKESNFLPRQRTEAGKERKVTSFCICYCRLDNIISTMFCRSDRWTTLRQGEKKVFPKSIFLSVHTQRIRTLGFGGSGTSENRHRPASLASDTIRYDTRSDPIRSNPSLPENRKFASSMTRVTAAMATKINKDRQNAIRSKKKEEGRQKFIWPNLYYFYYLRVSMKE